VALLLHDPEVVEADVRGDVAKKAKEVFPKRRRLRVIHIDRVDVDNGGNAEFGVHAKLHALCDLMGVHQRHARRDLCVKAHHPSARAVVVDQDVMDAEHLPVGEDSGLDVVNKFRILLLPKEGRGCLQERLETGDQDERGDRKATPAVDLDPAEIRKQGGQKDGTGGDAVVPRIACGGFQSNGGEHPGEAVVVGVHVQLDEDGDRKDHHGHQGEGGLLRRPDALDRLARKLKTDDEDHLIDHEACQVLHAAVPEGVLRIGLLPGESEADHREDGAPRIGEVVHGIRHDGDGGGEKAHCKLEGKQEHV